MIKEDTRRVQRHEKSLTIRNDKEELLVPRGWSGSPLWTWHTPAGDIARVPGHQGHENIVDRHRLDAQPNGR